MSNSSEPHLRHQTAPLSISQRQLSMAFESSVLQGISPSQRTSAIAQLASLLLQAAGVQQMGADDVEL